MENDDQPRLAPIHGGIQRGITIWKFSGNQVFYLVAALLAGFLTFAQLSAWGWQFLSALLLALLIPFSVGLMLLALKGKPTKYAIDYLEWQIAKRAKTPLLSRAASTDKQAKGDGYIIHDAILYGNIQTGARLSRGLLVSGPPWQNASNEQLSVYEHEFNLMLSLLASQGYEVQFRWLTSSDYQAVLKAYFDDTEHYGKDKDWSREQRNYYSVKYHHMLKEGRLRSAIGEIWLIHHLEPSSKGNVDELVQGALAKMDSALVEIARCYDRAGGFAKRMFAQDIQRSCRNHYNPGIDRRSGEETDQPFDPECSILQNCLTGDLTPSSNGEGIIINDIHHGILAMQSLPQFTYIGMINQLTGLAMSDYSVVLNIKPEDINTLIEREEKQIAKLKRSLRGGRSQESAQSDIEMRQTRIRNLMTGSIKPFTMNMKIHASAPTQDSLESKLSILQVALQRLGGAKPYRFDLPTSIRNAFFACAPGGAVACRSWEHYIESINLVHIISVAANASIGVEGCDAIYEGADQTLTGINLHTRDEDTQTIHTFISGDTGSGKSSGTIDLLSQAGLFCDFQVINDFGFSYPTYVKTLEGNPRPLVLEEDGQEVLNYLSTVGQPLDKAHISAAAGIVQLMAGKFAYEKSYRSVIIFNLVRDFFAHWVKQYRINHDAAPDIGNAACFSLMSEILQPQHAHLYEYAKLQYDKGSEYRDDLRELILHLGKWTRKEGQYTLFDGKGTVNFKNTSCFCLELSKLEEPKGEDDPSNVLRHVAAHVIANQVGQHIMSMSRDEKKVVVFEEVGAFLGIPGGDVILRHHFERMRKFHASCIAIIQQVENLTESVVNSVLGNAGQALIFRQTKEKNLRALQRAFSLPQSAVESVRNFDKPSKEYGSRFLHWLPQGERARITTCISRPSPEMLYVASSSPHVFDARERALAQYENPLEGIKAEANK